MEVEARKDLRHRADEGGIKVEVSGLDDSFYDE